ncbi:MAG: GspE/PulE family protein, partial [Clostridium sp.]
IYENINTRIKVMAQMDISNRYEVQDGEINIKIHGESFDFRVSSLPTIYGEKFVLRILKRNGDLLKLDSLGFSQEDYRILKNVLKFKQGLIIITGPTGSGKTSTLYAMIRELNKESRNIITVEKPVECTIEGINQVSIGSKGNLEYGKVLKAALRQDPDVIMVGEIIDKDTAETAVRASLTGHLVLTTLHTNDASSTINRLVDMGINQELLNSSLLLVIAQRLTRSICEHCKIDYDLSPEEKKLLGDKDGVIKAYKGIGCNKCNHTGFRGRTIAYEIMVIGERVKEAIKTKDDNLIRECAIQNGMITLEEYFKGLVFNGITTVDQYGSNMQVYSIERALGADYGV